MCGRNSLFHPWDDVEDAFEAEMAVEEYRPRFNIAPGQQQPVITNETPERIVDQRWGLVPHWMDDFGEGFINARSETAHEKPAFRDAWARQPCLVLSSGFYEWAAGDGGPKQPYRVHRADNRPFAMAGLWSEWQGEEDGVRRTFTILTTDPNDVVEPIHDRMPVVLEADRERDWLDAGPEERQAFCQPYPGDDLAAYPITTRVNDPANDDARVIEPLGTEQSDLGEFA